MKIVYLIIPIVLLSLVGCSTTHNLTEYNNSKEFYEDFNTSMQNKKARIILRNDSSFFVPDGLSIINDSIIIKNNSSKINKYILLKDVKEARYTNHWKGIGPGIGIGIVVGALMGSTGNFFDYREGGMHPETKDIGFDSFMGGLSGILIGAVVGLVVGWDNIYRFNP